MSKIEISFEHNLNDTVYCRCNGAVKKGVVVRRMYASETVGSLSRDIEKITYAVRFTPKVDNVEGGNVFGSQFVFAKPEDAFA